MDIILNRRSVRKYRPGSIPPQDITKLLRAAMRAPSAGNEQPWEFVVLQEKNHLEEIANFHPYGKMLREAACAIAVCGDIRRKKYPLDYWVQDCAAATQNMLLEAVYLGLGAVWLGVWPDEERAAGLQKMLELPAQVLPFSIVSLGYPAAEPQPVDTYLPQRIHRERWGHE